MPKRKVLSQILFACALVLLSATALLYLYNIIKWGDQPDYGYGFRTATGVRVVGVVMEVGRKAGMVVGDHILKVNGRTVSNYKEIHAARYKEIGAKNVYLIERDGRQLEIAITNNPWGIKRAFSVSGFPYLVGLCYFLIGILVFLMKPHYRTSWIFFLFASILGIFFMFLYKVSLMRPFELENLNIFGYTFAPAVVIHLALSFPEERNFLKNHPYAQFLPYVVSTILFLCIRLLVSTMMDIPKPLFIIFIVYFLVAVLVFLGSCLQLRITSPSELAKLRCKMILLGIAISASVPLLDTLNNVLFHVYVVPSFNYYLPFFVVFPLFVGYSVVKHDLFDIDAVIKRTYGYVLTTGAIAGVYALFVFLSNFLFGKFEVSRSPMFPFLFVLAVVFLFNPVRNRIQKVIDRVFYRLEYDYQTTLQKISETMRSLLNLDQIRKRIIDTVLSVMFIDSCCVMLSNPEEKVYEGLVIGYDAPMSKLLLSADEPLIQKIGDRKKEITVYDIQEDPFYEHDREACKKIFDRLQSTLIVPLIYENNLTGLISFGNKKSGKFYRREDINLLKTLANQGAVAIQNAKLADQMKTEEAVRTNLVRYLSPQIVDQIMKKDVQVNLGGDRKVVTVLFSDIRNFTRISESMPPDQLIQLLNEYFTEMAQIIFQNQGSLDKYIGDAIVAVFGSLIPLENPSETAVQAAIQMMKQMTMLNERWKNQYGFSMEMGIGINTGEVFLGNIGSPERMEFTVIGDTVNIASRFSGVAKGGQILVTKDSLNCLGSDIKYTGLPPVEVKGKTAKLEVFEIVY